tara:strand:- start:221 stop:436 length:216 start_codon:yes stop_codon:yes gene_type:complete
MNITFKIQFENLAPENVDWIKAEYDVGFTDFDKDADFRDCFKDEIVDALNEYLARNKYRSVGSDSGARWVL